MRKGIIALIVTAIVISPFIFNINEVSQSKDYITKSSYRFLSPENRQKMYTSAEEFDEMINSYAKILIIIAAIIVSLLVLIEYIKFYKIYREEKNGGG